MRLILLGLTASLVLSIGTLSAAEIDSALATIQTIGPKAAGAQAAGAAWKQLAQASAAQIPALLNAIDDEKPLTANYIRSAIETIAERESGKLPTDALEAFVKDTDNSPRARRLAFELLVNAAPDAERRLLGGMLQDPSAELRRDAVALAMNRPIEPRAEKVRVFRAAFDAAVDDDQVQALTKRLKDLGEEIDVARHYGFVMRWRIIGPFDNADEKGFARPRGPEGKPIDLAASYQGSHGVGAVKWQAVASHDDYGLVDINEALGKLKSAICYAVADFTAAEARPIQLRWKSKNACKVWLNGKLVDEREVYHSDGGPSLDQYICTGKLKKGANTILLKVCQNDQQESWAQSWAFQLRVCDAVGAAVLAENRDETAVVPSDAATQP